MLSVRVCFNPGVFSNFVRNGSEWKLSMYHERISIRSSITQMKRNQKVLPKTILMLVIL